jgi:hypothetical protein
MEILLILNRQVVRWSPPRSPGVIFANVYVPAFTAGVSVSEIRLLEQLFGDLRNDFPGDTIFLGGDFNVDRWRIVEARNLGLPIRSQVR